MGNHGDQEGALDAWDHQGAHSLVCGRQAQHPHVLLQHKLVFLNTTRAWKGTSDDAADWFDIAAAGAKTNAACVAQARCISLQWVQQERLQLWLLDCAVPTVLHQKRSLGGSKVDIMRCMQWLWKAKCAKAGGRAQRAGTVTVLFGRERCRWKHQGQFN